MLKNIFLPERINTQYLFSQNLLGLEITKSSLTATLLHVSGKSAAVKEFYTEPLNKKSDEEVELGTATALKNLFKKTGKSCQLHLAIPNNIAIFKELTVPFLEQEQIQQILPFELESQIPFAIKDILFDFLIIKQDKQQKKSTILVGIVTQKDADYYLKLIANAGYPLHAITIDLFALYGLYAIHPVYSTFNKPVTLIDIGFSYTTIAYITNNQLAGIRTINQGIGSLAKNIAEKINDTPAQVIEFISRFGFIQTDKPAFNEAIDQELASFVKQIQFTFDAQATQITNYQTPQKIIINLRSTPIKEFDIKIGQLLALPAEFFDAQALVNTNQLKLTHVLNKIPLNNIISLGSVYPFSPVSLFNLLAYQKTPLALTLLRNQLVATIFTLLTVVALAIGYSYMQYTTARSQLNSAKQSALALISQEFDITDRNLNTAVDTAQQKLEESAAIWGSISGQSRLSCLKYLQELCIKIDRDGIGLDLKKLVMNKKIITLNGQVRDFPALKTLEEELSNSKLFTLITVSQDPKFEIRLAIKNTSEEPA